jgi:hypothetical protein
MMKYLYKVYVDTGNYLNKFEIHPPSSVPVSAGTGTEELALAAVLENFHCPNCF